MARARTYSPQTRDAVQLLGMEIARARRARRWAIAELAERAGFSRITVRAAEQGSLTVSIGTVFEIATILGIELFGPPEQMDDLLTRSRDRLALLPSRVREPANDVDDDF